MLNSWVLGLGLFGGNRFVFVFHMAGRKRISFRSRRLSDFNVYLLPYLQDVLTSMSTEVSKVLVYLMNQEKTRV